MLPLWGWDDQGIDERQYLCRASGPICANRDQGFGHCLTMKVLLGMVPRQTAGFVERLLRLIALNLPAPDFSTLRDQGRGTIP